MGGEGYQQLLMEFQEVQHVVNRVLKKQEDIEDKLDALINPGLKAALGEVEKVIRVNNEALTRLAEALEQGFGLWRVE